MNLIFRITSECMMRNKKRTLVTILGVIISVAMVCGVSTISSSFLDLMRQSSIERSGDWFISYENVPSENLKYLDDEGISATMISSQVGYAKLDNIKNPYKPYVYISAQENESISKLPIQLIEGQFPQNEHEIMIPSSLLKMNGDMYQIGEHVTFQVGQRFIEDYDDDNINQRYAYNEDETLINMNEKAYTITGIYDDRMYYQSMTAGYDVITCFENGIYNAEMYDVKLKTTSVSYGLYDYAMELTSKLGVQDYTTNSTLLLTYGINDDAGIMTTITIAVAIVGIIILIGSVSLIYNAFAISLSERSRYLGMLSSVGATKKQKRNSVYYEAAIIGMIAIPIGFLAGYMGMWITFHFVDKLLVSSFLEAATFGNLHLRLVIDMKSFLAALLFSILILFISAWRPALKASRISPIDAIRQSGETQINRKNVKTLKMTRRFFGFEAELALKNMKRNKSRYISTLFSLIISIVLFLSVSSFQGLIKKSFAMTTKDIPGNVEVIVRGTDGSAESENYIKELMQVDGMESAVRMDNVDVFMKVPEHMISKELAEYMNQDDNDSILVSLLAYEDDVLQNYCDSLGIACEDLKQDDLSGILVNQVMYQDGHDYQDIDVLKVSKGDSLPLQFYNEKTKNMDEIPMKLQTITSIAPPMKSNKVGSLDVVNVVVSKQTMNTLLSQVSNISNDDRGMTLIIYQGDDSYLLESQLQEIKEQNPQYMSYITNYDNVQKQQSQMTSFVSIFLYGFVALILLISCANIFNTISTGVALRKQEFAMLKSVGITPKGFRKMLCYENLFYGIKALFYGLPISCLVAYGMYTALSRNFGFAFFLPWQAILLAIIGIFLLVFTTMFYAIHKVKHDNIIDTIKNESI